MREVQQAGVINNLIITSHKSVSMHQAAAGWTGTTWYHEPPFHFNLLFHIVPLGAALDLTSVVGRWGEKMEVVLL